MDADWELIQNFDAEIIIRLKFLDKTDHEFDIRVIVICNDGRRKVLTEDNIMLKGLSLFDH